jgi:hypothetical protein
MQLSKQSIAWRAVWRAMDALLTSGTMTEAMLETQR